MTHRTAADIERAKLHRRVHAMLRAAKLARWKISLTAADRHWRMTSPGGAAVTIAATPTMRALLAAEVQFARIEQQYLQPTAGQGLAQARTEPCLDGRKSLTRR